jgi:hypothetical protein
MTRALESVLDLVDENAGVAVVVSCGPSWLQLSHLPRWAGLGRGMSKLVDMDTNN